MVEGQAYALYVTIPRGVNQHHMQGGQFLITTADRARCEELMRQGQRYNPERYYRIEAVPHDIQASAPDA